jgi:hypothetical protein
MATNGMDTLESIAAINKKDVAVLIDAQAGMIGGFFDLMATCQKEMLQSAMDAATAALPWMAAPKTQSAGIALFFDTVTQAAQNSTARSNLLTQTMSLSSGSVSGALSARWYAALDEWKTTLMAAVSPTAAP